MRKKTAATATMVNTIQEKQTALKRLQTKSNQALDLVTTTINNLTTVNAEIDSTIADITELQSQLQNVQNDLATTKDRNSRVVEKFKNLIEV